MMYEISDTVHCGPKYQNIFVLVADSSSINKLLLWKKEGKKKETKTIWCSCDLPKNCSNPRAIVAQTETRFGTGVHSNCEIFQKMKKREGKKLVIVYQWGKAKIY